ncbi:MAG TPA: DUF5317 domain-containing protein [Clostridiaceae bacterium]|nr:DUF5317 domain-containing protein [Clostridiaceae bacterium]
MLYILPIVLGFAMGIAMKGKLGNVLNFRLEKAWILLLAFVIQAGAQIMSFNGLTGINDYTVIIQGCVIILLLIGFWYNRKYAGIIIMSFGFFLNAIVMMLNGGKMPVSYDILQKNNLREALDLLLAGRDSKHALIDENTKLWFLSDVIYMPGIFRYAGGLVSIGDLVIAAGIFVLVAEVVSNRIGLVGISQESTTKESTTGKE